MTETAPLAAPPPPPPPPAPAPAAPTEPRRYPRPGREFWLAGAAAAVVVLVAAAGFLVGRASVDHVDRPSQIQGGFPQQLPQQQQQNGGPPAFGPTASDQRPGS